MGCATSEPMQAECHDLFWPKNATSRTWSAKGHEVRYDHSIDKEFELNWAAQIVFKDDGTYEWITTQWTYVPSAVHMLDGRTKCHENFVKESGRYECCTAVCC